MDDELFETIKASLPDREVELAAMREGGVNAVQQLYESRVRHLREAKNVAALYVSLRTLFILYASQGLREKALAVVGEMRDLLEKGAETYGRDGYQAWLDLVRNILHHVGEVGPAEIDMAQEFLARAYRGLEAEGGELFRRYSPDCLQLEIDARRNPASAETKVALENALESAPLRSVYSGGIYNALHILVPVGIGVDDRRVRLALRRIWAEVAAMVRFDGGGYQGLLDDVEKLIEQLPPGAWVRKTGEKQKSKTGRRKQKQPASSNDEVSTSEK